MNKSDQNKRTISPIVIIAAILIGLLAVLLLPNVINNQQAQQTLLKAEPNCDLHNSSCTATDANQKVTLDIKAEKIHSANPMQFEVSLDSIQADQVMLDLKGKDMYMGLNQVMLTKLPGNLNRWQGEVTLAVCTTGEMTWVTSVIAEKNGKLTQADFEFKAQ